MSTSATTQAPTQAPTTQAPTQAPTTQAPTQAPTTQAPTQAPTTQAPTQAPTTQAPTQAPTTQAPNSLGWAINIPSTPANTASLKIRVMIDGVEQTSGYMAGFNPDGYITAVASSTSLVPVGPYSGWNIFSLSLQGDAGEIHSIHFSPDGVQDLVLTPTYTFVNNDGSYLEFTAVTTVTQTWDLSIGWNWVTLSVAPDDMSIASILSGFENNDRILLQGSLGDAQYYDGFGWYSASGLTELTVGVGFKIYVSTARQVSHTGTMKDTVTYNLNTGWTWIGLPISEPLPIVDFLSGTFANNDRFLLQGALGDAQFYDGYGWYSASGLTEFKPGQTLKVFKVEGGSFTFTPASRRRFNLRNVIRRVRRLRHRK